MERYDLMGTPYASGNRAGILRTANAVDEKNSGCTDAAITPSNLHNVLGCRKPNTAYTGNEIVACPYHAQFMLKCTQAGTTSANSLNTTSVTVGQVITDGGVKWKVINNVWEVATQTEAETGTDNSKIMTPLGVVQAISANRKIKTYSSLYQIGFTEGHTNLKPSDLLDLMPNWATINIWFDRNNTSELKPPRSGYLFAYRHGDNIIRLQHDGTLNGKRSVGAILSDGTFTGWIELDNIYDDNLNVDNGFVQFSNGFIVQWARVNLSNANPFVITKAKPFITYAVLPHDYSSSDAGNSTRLAWGESMSTTTSDSVYGNGTIGAALVVIIGKVI